MGRHLHKAIQNNNLETVEGITAEIAMLLHEKIRYDRLHQFQHEPHISNKLHTLELYDKQIAELELRLLLIK